MVGSQFQKQFQNYPKSSGHTERFTFEWRERPMISERPTKIFLLYFEQSGHS